MAKSNEVFKKVKSKISDRDLFSVILATTDQEYLEKVLLQRVPNLENGEPNPNQFGSVYPGMKPSDLLHVLVSSPDIRKLPQEESECLGVMPICTTFMLPLPGELGITGLSEKDDGLYVRLVDPKGTGKLSPVIDDLDHKAAKKENYSLVICGPTSDEDPTLCVWTMHPGSAVSPSTLKVGQYQDGDVITVKEARSLGFDMAKIAVDDELAMKNANFPTNFSM